MIKHVFYKVIRFVDDYLVVFNRNNKQNEDRILYVALRLFHDKADLLEFTSGVLVTGKLCCSAAESYEG